MKSIDKCSFRGKKTIIRVDFNVPLDDHKKVTDNSRIEAAKATILKVINDGGSCILMSHLGRPKGVDQEFSLKHILNEIELVLGLKVKFVSQAIGEKVNKAVRKIKAKEVLLLENLRFHPEEIQGDEGFAKTLASYADCYINDAFGTAHRAHASTCLIAKHFPENKFAGRLLLKEVESIKRVLQSGEKPVLGILGGAKVSSKITIIDNIIEKVDQLIIGGGMAFTFVKALGGKIGNSICEDEKLELALSILEKAKEKKVTIHLPLDVVCGDEFSNEANTQVSEINNIPDGWEGMDAGPKSIKAFDRVISMSKTILWNGPVGVFEFDKFSKGTIALGESISKSTKNGSFSLVGGGDSVAAVKKFNFENKVSHVSTGGGAMLESLEGKTLPGIKAIMS
jgi:phosphoglycerate kinase